MPRKILTVVSWDARYREDAYLKLSLDCLAKQTIKNNVNFIHIEWYDKPNPIILDYDFVNVYCLGFLKDTPLEEIYDVGLQWSIGMYLAETPYVTYFHNDIITRYQLEVIEHKILQHPEMILFSGYGCYGQKMDAGKHLEDIVSPQLFFELIEASGDDFDLLPENFRPQAAPTRDCHLLTFNKEKLISYFGGFPWNYLSMRWDALGTHFKRVDPIRHKQFPGGIVCFAEKHNLGMVKQKDMKVFPYPHGGQGKRMNSYDIGNMQKKNGGTRYWQEFIQDWLPKNKHRLLLYRKKEKL